MAMNAYMNKKVVVLTTDGRTLVGTLISTDQSTNLVLSECYERVIRPEEDPIPSSQTYMGVYMIRGDTVAVCGLMDVELDASITWENVRGEVIGSTKH
ncbi:Sm-like ribonucleoprotein [Delitschia confertaspora ATCC 74209]|uniref:LSM2-LSM8 complex subunit LSM8 n=1 Tax=Delitschia confertaspora ATCC 74209 TaxID=1513339 RepID=A0A9P4JGQ1_9PLEO|nr:Sm-like ribonucleoprotein [Delitschia confertaspora ATCC 74209]